MRSKTVIFEGYVARVRKHFDWESVSKEFAFSKLVSHTTFQRLCAPKESNSISAINGECQDFMTSGQEIQATVPALNS
jgi:hypothetical protein